MARAQTSDAHEAQPERPSVATHAFTVTSGFLEIETGVQRQAAGTRSSAASMPVLLKIGLGRRVQLDVGAGWQRDVEDGVPHSGITDILVAAKWRLADDAPVVGAFALQAGGAIPAESGERGFGSGTVSASLLLISSRQIGPVALDVNAGYTWAHADRFAPRHTYLWAVAAGFPVAGRLGWCAEVFGIPGTIGPAGNPPQVALLTGPTLTLHRRIVVDAGAILNLEGFGGTAVYAGLTWNLGQVWRARPRAARGPVASARSRQRT